MMLATALPTEANLNRLINRVLANERATTSSAESRAEQHRLSYTEVDHHYSSLGQRARQEGVARLLLNTCIDRAAERGSLPEDYAHKLMVTAEVARLFNPRRSFNLAEKVHEQLFGARATTDAGRAAIPEDTIFVAFKGDHRNRSLTVVDSAPQSLLIYRMANELTDPAFNKHFMTEQTFRALAAKGELQHVKNVVILDDIGITGTQLLQRKVRFDAISQEAKLDDVSLTFACFAGTHDFLARMSNRLGENVLTPRQRHSVFSETGDRLGDGPGPDSPVLGPGGRAQPVNVLAGRIFDRPLVQMTPDGTAVERRHLFPGGYASKNGCR